MAKFLLFLVASLLPKLLLAQSVADNLSSTKLFTPAIIDQIKKASVFPEGTQLSVAIRYTDTVAYLGCIRKTDSLIAISNEESIFEIGSISKVFTSMLLAHAVQDNLVQLDQPISELLSFPLHSEADITLRQLSNHTSGLPRLPENLFPIMAKSPDNPYQDYDDAALEDYLRNQMNTIDPPGRKSSYSNLGAGLLGYLMEQVYASTYEDILQEKILVPLDMQATSSDGQLNAERQVSGLNRKGKPASHWDFQALAGAGAIRSSTVDLMKFAHYAMEENAINKLIQLETMHIADDTGVALGWHTMKHNADNWVWHNGGTGGFRSCLAVCPEKKWAIAILSNVSAFHNKSSLLDEICFEIAKLLK